MPKLDIKPEPTPKRSLLGARVTDELRARLKKRAKKQKVSVNALCEQLLTWGLDTLDAQDAKR